MRNMMHDQRTAEAANILLAVHAGGTAPVDFPESCRPGNRQDAYAIQAMVAPSLGPIGGWKVGGPSPDAEPMCSPLPRSGIFISPATVPGPLRYRGVEAEINFRIGRELPPRGEPYTRDDLLVAIESCHAAIEIVECRFAEMDGATHLSALADLQNHHALVVGAANIAWGNIPFDRLSVRVEANGRQIAGGSGSNPAGDPVQAADLAGEPRGVMGRRPESRRYRDHRLLDRQDSGGAARLYHRALRRLSAGPSAAVLEGWKRRWPRTLSSSSAAA